MNTECENLTRYIHTPDGWQEYLNHLDSCQDCKDDLANFYDHKESPDA